jgi:two-component system phosphate regulon sensor histidine kinase PhoR
MKSLQKKIIISFSLLMATFLAGLGIILSQLFSVYIEDAVQSNSKETCDEVSLVLEESGRKLTDTQLTEVNNILSNGVNRSDLNEVRKKIWVMIGIVLLAGFLLVFIFTIRMAKKHAQPIDNVTEVAIELAKGNYRARAYEDVTSNSVHLSTTINILARNLQDISRTREIEQERLNTLIENMGSALLMIGRDGRVTIVNKSFLSQISKSLKDIQYQPFKGVGLPKDVEDLIDFVFLTESAIRKQLRLTFFQNQRHMEVYGAPVIGEHGRWLGVVIVMHDITDLVRLEQIRKDFVANVSHELRTPVTSIKGFTETLLDGALKDENTLTSFLEIINKESNRLQVLIEDLLELSKIEQQGFSIEFSTINLKDVMIRATEMAEPRMVEKSMTLQRNFEHDVFVEADFNRLIQVMTNLLTNAITYSPENTTIIMKLIETETHGILHIQDEGIGIEESELSRIFERFYRVDRARSRQSGGTGLGLAIVKHLVEAHHGIIVVNSVVGKGTTMEISIPKKNST